jgi:hypothetical protein
MTNCVGPKTKASKGEKKHKVLNINYFGKNKNKEFTVQHLTSCGKLLRIHARKTKSQAI